jgi:hypothetical protein
MALELLVKPQSAVWDDVVIPDFLPPHFSTFSPRENKGQRDTSFVAYLVGCDKSALDLVKRTIDKEEKEYVLIVSEKTNVREGGIVEDYEVVTVSPHYINRQFFEGTVDFLKNKRFPFKERHYTVLKTVEDDESSKEFLLPWTSKAGFESQPLSFSQYTLMDELGGAKKPDAEQKEQIRELHATIGELFDSQIKSFDYLIENYVIPKEHRHDFPMFANSRNVQKMLCLKVAAFFAVCTGIYFALG